MLLHSGSAGTERLQLTADCAGKRERELERERVCERERVRERERMCVRGEREREREWEGEKEHNYFRHTLYTYVIMNTHCQVMYRLNYVHYIYEYH